MPARADARKELRLPRELLDRVLAACGPGNFSEWARQAFEAKLAGGAVGAAPVHLGQGDPGPDGSGQSAPASVPPSASRHHTDVGGTLPTPGCPECGENMEHVEGFRWRCPGCGWTGP